MLTIPGLKHVIDEEVNEADLCFGEIARAAIKAWHHDGKTLLVFFLSLYTVRK